MKVIIAGSRNFTDYNVLKQVCSYYLTAITTEIEVVSGTARGTDTLGEKFAEEKGYKVTKFPADWSTFGKSAGYRRNKQMAEYADALIAFWDEESKGTKHMIDLAKEHGLLIRIYRI